MKNKAHKNRATRARPDGTFDFESLTAVEKEAFYAECEKVGAETPSEKLTAAQERAHRRVLGRGRPRIGRGAQRTQLTLERGLLEEVDQFAKSQGLSRSGLVSRALRAYMKPVA